MTDMTLCSSTDCLARTDCRRNSACPAAIPADSIQQSYAIWHPPAGYGCPGFIDGREKHDRG